MKQLRVYLTGKVEGNKWKVVQKEDPRFKFVSSDGSNHSEHLSGACIFDFEECNNKRGVYADLVNSGFIQNFHKSHILLAYLDCTTSYGSIAEIAWASAFGKPIHVIIKRGEPVDPEDHASSHIHPDDADGMHDAYYFVCSFPNVTVYEVQSLSEGRQKAYEICNREHSIRFVNSYKFMME